MNWEQTEADTRAELIDPKLADAGWVTGGDVQVLRERPVTDGQSRYGKQRGPVTKPYNILSYKGSFLAVIEAKKVVKASATVLLRLRLIHKKFEPKQPLPPMVTRFTRSATSRELRVRLIDFRRLRSSGREHTAKQMSGLKSLLQSHSPTLPGSLGSIRGRL